MFPYKNHKFNKYVDDMKAQIRRRYGKLYLFKLWLCSENFLLVHKELDPQIVGEFARDYAEKYDVKPGEIIEMKAEEMSMAMAYMLCFESFEKSNRESARQINLDYDAAADRALAEYYDQYDNWY